jgi:hypothetical protein
MGHCVFTLPTAPSTTIASEHPTTETYFSGASAYTTES